MSPVRPMLDDVELELVQQLEIDGDQILEQHSVPALDGDFFQRLGRRATLVTLNGVLVGPAAGGHLKTLREKFRAAEPVPFVADIATATRVDQVLIEEMGVRELAGKPERFEYAFTLREFTPPPPVTTEEPPPPPPDPDPPPRRDDPINERVGTLVVEVIVEGQPNFDFSRIDVNVQGIQEDGTVLTRLLINRTNNLWREEAFPAGSYTASATVRDDPSMVGSVQATVQAGQTTQVTITLRSGFIIAKAFVVHFRFDKAFIEPCMRAVMRQIAQHAINRPDEKLLIVGHTDKAGSDQYNQSLSERRARSAFAFLRFGNNSTESESEWRELRQRQTPGQLPTLHDTWGTREYQHMLQDLGLYRGNIDGNHGSQTDTAIQAFCCLVGLPSRTTMDDPTWDALIHAYLTQDNLSIPDSQFLPNAKDGCDNGILKWLGCGEETPTPKWGTPPRSTAWRPYRRTEFLFVRTAVVPCDVPQPSTFNLPTTGAVGSGWCLGPTSPQPPHCCFISYTQPADADRTRLWFVQPAERGGLTVQGRIRFEGLAPGAQVRSTYVLISPEGEFVDGETGSGSASGEPTGRSINGTADASGVFEHTFNHTDKTEGVYTLEVRGDFVTRLDGEPVEAATRSIVCKRLETANPNFNVIVIPRPTLTITPTITLESAVVVVKKPHTNPKRRRVTLRGTFPFCDGDGTFLSSDTSKIQFFDAFTGGNRITFNGVDNVFTGVQLFNGVELFAEGVTASAAMDDVILSLSLGRPGVSAGPPLAAPATATMTAVELTLDICQPRTAPGVDPVPLSQTDKVNPGRILRIRNGDNSHSRALVIVRAAQPAAFVGDLSLTLIGNQVQLFSAIDEVPPAGTVLTMPQIMTNASIPSTGLRFWVEGANLSAALRDTGLQLGIRDLEPDGDRVAVTVIDVALTNNVAPFDTRVNRVQVEGILNSARTSFDISDLINTQANSLFRIRVDIPGVVGTTVQARLQTVRLGGSPFGAARLITLTRTSGNRFASLPILAIPLAFPLTDITFKAPQDIEVIQAQAGGELRLNVDGFLDSPERIVTRVRGRVVELCVVTIQGASPNPNRDLGTANRVFAQDGIEFRVLGTSTVNNPAVLDINPNGCPLTIGGDSNRNAQEQTLFALGRSTCSANLIAYYVRSITGLNGCSAFPTGSPGATIGDSATQYTFGHEIGHVLGLPHLSDPVNLMNNTTTTLTTPNQTMLRATQCLILDGSSFVVMRG